MWWAKRKDCVILTHRWHARRTHYCPSLCSILKNGILAVTLPGDTSTLLNDCFHSATLCVILIEYLLMRHPREQLSENFEIEMYCTATAQQHDASFDVLRPDHNLIPSALTYITRKPSHIAASVRLTRNLLTCMLSYFVRNHNYTESRVRDTSCHMNL